MRYFLLCVVIVIVGIIAFTFYQENKSLKAEYKQMSDLKDSVNAYNTIVGTTHDSLGQKTIIRYIPIETNRNIGDFVSKSVADTLQAALKIALKDVKSWKSFAITLQDSLKGTRYQDHKGAQWAQLKDKTFDIRYNIDSNLWIPKVTIKPELLTYRSRKSIFHPYKYYSAIIVSDDRAQISLVQDITKVKQPSRWGIGAFGGPIMTPNGFSYGVGLGVTYDLISF